MQKQNVNLQLPPFHDQFTEILGAPTRTKLLSTLAGVEEALRDASLPLRFHRKLERAKTAAEEDPFNPTVVKTLFREIAHDLIDELSGRMFLFVRVDRRHLYEQLEAPFGEAVESKFSEASRDIAAACRCLALDEWTACVLHLMRALETPLHTLADCVGISFPGPLELQNWKNIIDEIEKKIDSQVKALENQKRSLSRNRELKSYAEAAMQFRHFKNAWRNNAAHGRDHYDEREAVVVFDAVRSFMQTIVGAV